MPISPIMLNLLSIHINDLAFYTTLRLHYARQCQPNLDLFSMFNWTYAAFRARGCAASGVCVSASHTPSNAPHNAISPIQHPP